MSPLITIKGENKMEKHYFYEPSNSEIKRKMKKAYAFMLFMGFIMLLFFTLLPCVGIYLLSLTQIGGPIFPTLLLIRTGTICGLFFILLTIIAFCVAGKHKIDVVISENISIKTESFLGEDDKIIIDYKDAKRIYIPFYAKSFLWKKFVGYYPLSCKNCKEIRNGQPRCYSRNVTRTIFWSNDLDEVKELVQYIKQNTQYKKR